MVRPPIAPTQKPHHNDEASELSSITHEYRALTKPQEDQQRQHSSSFEETFDDEMTPQNKPPLPTEVLLPPLERVYVVGISRNNYNHDNNNANNDDDDDATVMNVDALMRPLPCPLFCRILLPPWLRRAPPWLQLSVLGCLGLFLLSAVLIFASVAWRLRGSDQSNAAEWHAEWRGIGLPTAPSAVPTQQIVAATAVPSAMPTREPSYRPSAVPSRQPSLQPTAIPTLSPSGIPSGEPSLTPSAIPSGHPTSTPTSNPSSMPSSKSTGNATATSSSTGNATDFDFSTNDLPNNATLSPKTVNVTQSSEQHPTATPLQPSATPSALAAPSVVSRPSRIPSAAPSGQPSRPTGMQMGVRRMMMTMMGGTTSSSASLSWWRLQQQQQQQQRPAPPTSFPTFAKEDEGTRQRGRG